MPTSDDERKLILKAYCELGQIERSHSNTQTSYRTLASTWMLAAFAGIGFVISSQGFSFDIPKEVFILAIALAGGIGLFLLWILDLMFYQRLLDAAFIEARRLETTHDWLPQPRNKMRALLRGKGLQIVIWYYIALAEVMLLIFGAGLVLLVALNTRTFLDLRTGTIAALCVIVAFAWAALMIEIAKVMKRKTSITPTFEDDLERTYRVPIEDLWELWTTKAGFESWWGPEGFRVEVHALEARAGGALEYDMIAHAPDSIAAMKRMGQPLSHGTRGRFAEFKPLERRLTLVHVIDFIPGVEPYESTIGRLPPVGRPRSDGGHAPPSPRPALDEDVGRGLPQPAHKARQAVRRTGAIGPCTAVEATHRRRGVATFGPLVAEKSLLAANITGPVVRT